MAPKRQTRGVKRVFGDNAKDIPMSSIKSMMGHLIAAAGAVEFITCVLAIRDGMLPPTINYGTPDPALDLDYVPNKARAAKVYAGAYPLTADDVAETMVRMVSRPAHVCVDEVILKPTDQAAFHKVFRRS